MKDTLSGTEALARIRAEGEVRVSYSIRGDHRHIFVPTGPMPRGINGRTFDSLVARGLVALMKPQDDWRWRKWVPT